MRPAANIVTRRMFAYASLALLLICSLFLVSDISPDVGPYALNLASTAQEQVTRAEAYNNYNQFRGDNNNTGVCTEKNTPTEKFLWKFKTDSTIDSSATIVDFKLYFGSGDRNVYCLDAEYGERIWNYTTNNKVSGTPLVTGGRVYIGSDDKNMYCLDANNGTKIWNYTTKFGISSSAKELGDRIYFGSDDGNIYCLNKSDGGKVWNYSMSPKRTQIWSSAAISDGLLYIGAENGKMVCLDAKDGGLVFEINVGPTGDIFTTVCLYNGSLIFADGIGQHIWNYNAKTGQKIWVFNTPEDTYASVAAHNGKLFFSDYLWVYCIPFLDPNGDKTISDGEVIWKYPIENFEGGSSPLIVDSQVIIGTQVNVFALDESLGTMVWEYYTGEKTVSSPVFVNNLLYFGCYDEHMYCLRGEITTVTPGDNTTDDGLKLKFYPTIMIPLGVFLVLDIALLVVILVVWKKKKAVRPGVG